MKTDTLPQAPFLNASESCTRSAAVSAARAKARLCRFLHRAIVVCYVTFCLAFIFLIAWQIHRSFPGN